jgi:hypothetical protein
VYSLIAINDGVSTSPNVAIMQNTSETTKRKHGRRNTARLHPYTLRILQNHRGTTTKIAHAMGCNLSYVLDVINGVKPPSERFLAVLPDVLAEIASDATRAALITAHPEAAEAIVGPA